jgi:hypothetical protein
VFSGNGNVAETSYILLRPHQRSRGNNTVKEGMKIKRVEKDRREIYV